MQVRYRLLVALLAVLVMCPAAFAQGKDDEIEEEKKWESSYRSLADVPEVEPNNSASEANILGCGNTLRPAALLPAGDNDWFSFTANAGDRITLGTDRDPASSPNVDTFIHLYSSDGTTQLASNDDGGPGPYSLISNFVAPYTGVYYGRVRHFSATGIGTYKAFVVCCAAGTFPPNDRCEGALPVGCGPINLSGDTHCATNNYTLPTGAASCTRFTAAGRDLAYKITVAAGDSIALDYRNSADGSIYILSRCDSINTTTCVAGEDSTLEGGLETVRYKFTVGGDYWIIVDTFGTNTSGTWTLTGSLSGPGCPVPTVPTTWGRVKERYR